MLEPENRIVPANDDTSPNGLNAGCDLSPFISKLWEIVVSPATDNCIAWTPAGNSFMVTNVERFAHATRRTHGPSRTLPGRPSHTHERLGVQLRQRRLARVLQARERPVVRAPAQHVRRARPDSQPAAPPRAQHGSSLGQEIEHFASRCRYGFRKQTNLSSDETLEFSNEHFRRNERELLLQIKRCAQPKSAKAEELDSPEDIHPLYSGEPLALGGPDAPPAELVAVRSRMGLLQERLGALQAASLRALASALLPPPPPLTPPTHPLHQTMTPPVASAGRDPRVQRLARPEGQPADADARAVQQQRAGAAEHHWRAARAATDSLRRAPRAGERRAGAAGAAASCAAHYGAGGDGDRGIRERAAGGAAAAAGLACPRRDSHHAKLRRGHRAADAAAGCLSGDARPPSHPTRTPHMPRCARVAEPPPSCSLAAGNACGRAAGRAAGRQQQLLPAAGGELWRAAAARRDDHVVPGKHAGAPRRPLAQPPPSPPPPPPPLTHPLLHTCGCRRSRALALRARRR